MPTDIGPVLLCDGTPRGLLSALFDAEAMRPRARAILLEQPLQIELFSNPLIVETDDEKAVRVYRAIQTKLPADAQWIFESVYACNRADRGTLLMRYLRVGWQVGTKLGQHIAHPDVWEATAVSRKVGCEVHLLKGLVRFRQVNGVFYSRVAPDHDVIGFLAPHFADRLSDQNWVMHDEIREKAVIYHGERGIWTMLDLPADDVAEEREDVFAELWGAYHKAIAIKERVNPRVQKQHMPVRYWKNLVEMKHSEDLRRSTL